MMRVSPRTATQIRGVIGRQRAAVETHSTRRCLDERGNKKAKHTHTLSLSLTHTHTLRGRQAALHAGHVTNRLLLVDLAARASQ